VNREGAEVTSTGRAFQTRAPGGHGLVQRSAAVWRGPAFIAYEPSELTQ